MRAGRALLRREHCGDGRVRQKDERRAVRNDPDVGADERIVFDCGVLAQYPRGRSADRTGDVFVAMATRLGDFGVGAGEYYALLAHPHQRNEIYRHVGGGGDYALFGGGGRRSVGNLWRGRSDAEFGVGRND